MSTARTMRLTPELVALCHRVVEREPDFDEQDYFVESHYERAVDGLLASRPGGPFWLFAYGSLMWKPEGVSVESIRAMARGWHRAFSMKIDRYRATPEQEGYMMCLDPGGSCEGMLLRLDEASLRSQLYALLFREIGNDAQLEAVRWIDVEDEGGVRRALTFYAGPTLLDYYLAGRSLVEVAQGLARACGSWGSGADYLHNTVAHLEQLGIHDENMWQLQELVAAEIEVLYREKAAG
jgi:glutathione-specific gamma-glutamylcyclotransferase